MKKISLVQNPSFSCISTVSVAAQMHESVRLAARLHFLAAACLPKSLVLADMLSAYGIKAAVVIGVSKNDGRFSSHAWVEIEGQMVVEAESVVDTFTRLNR